MLKIPRFGLLFFAITFVIIILGAQFINTALFQGRLLVNNDQTPYLVSRIQRHVDRRLSVNPLTPQELTMAFVLVVEEPADATAWRLAKLREIKDSFDDAFKLATDGKMLMDTSADVVILQLNDEILDDYYENTDEIYLNDFELSKAFYRQNDDVFDFVTYFTTFDSPQPRHHTHAQNKIRGIGLDLYDDTQFYGANNHRLLGFSVIKNIDVFDDFISTVSGANRNILHETGHQWCCFVGENFNYGQNSKQLEILQDSAHFYIGLESPYENHTPMGSISYAQNRHGTFDRNSESETLPYKYHPFQLYFMGLLDEAEYATEYRVLDARIGANAIYQGLRQYTTVSVEDIIEVEGARTVAQ